MEKVWRGAPVYGTRVGFWGPKGDSMLYWAVVCLVIAIIAGVLGFGGIAGTAAGIAKILFFVFLALLVISLLANAFRGKGPKP